MQGLVLLACALLAGAEPETEHWERDVTDSMQIGATLSGYSNVTLLCGAEDMQLQIQLDEDFDGVLYARGAYHSREAPCFLDAAGGRNFTLRLPFDKCNTDNDGGVYSNTIVLQHDDELVMPGDAAFKVECHLRQSNEFTVTADLSQQRSSIQSRITLADADPAAKEVPVNQRITVAEESDRVTFNPRLAARSVRDEL